MSEKQPQNKPDGVLGPPLPPPRPPERMHVRKPDPVKRKADGMFITIRFNKDEIGLYRAIEWYAGHFSKPGQKCKHSTAVKRLLNAYLDGKELPG